METIDLVLPEISTSGNLPSMQLPDVGDYNFWHLYNNRILSLDEDITQWDYHIAKDIIKNLSPNERLSDIIWMI